MAIEVTWRDGGDSWTYTKGGNLTYHVTGTADEGAAIAAVLLDSDCPATYQSIPRLSTRISLKSDGLVNAANAASSGWIVTVPYGIASASVADQTYWRLSSAQASGRIIRSLTGTSTNFNASPNTMPALSGYIGVDLTGQRTPAGVSIAASAFAVSGSWTMSASAVTETYLQSLVQLKANPVNSDTFDINIAGVDTSFAAGECLIDFLETPQAPRSDGKLQFSATILISPNVTSGTIYGVSGVTKKGWQYAEPYYQTKKDGTFLVPNALGVSITDVYGTSSYAPIDGGT